jgi:hypothetical protein
VIAGLAIAALGAYAAREESLNSSSGSVAPHPHGMQGFS